ncbi:MAG: hypothetical protein WA183_01035 [Chthoniobacterales bacterium]
MISQRALEKEILELCSEDDFGSWELWWKIHGDHHREDEEQLKRWFVNAVAALVNCGTVIAKKRLPTGDMMSTTFQLDKLNRDLAAADDPDPDRNYWFGIGERESK